MKYFDFVKLQSESADLWIRGESFTTEMVVNVMCDGDLSTCERIFTHRQRILRPRIVYVWETRCSLTWCISNARSIFVAMRDSDIAFCAILYWMLATWPNYNFWRSFHLGSHIMSLTMTLDVKSCPAARKFYRPSGNKLGSSIRNYNRFYRAVLCRRQPAATHSISFNLTQLLPVSSDAHHSLSLIHISEPTRPY